MRIASGIILGYLVFAGSAFLLFCITGHDPHSPASIRFEIGAIVFGVLFSGLAGFIASFIGGRRDMFAAKCVAILLALVAIVSAISTGVCWSQIWAVIAMAPAVLLGGWMYRIKVGDR